MVQKILKKTQKFWDKQVNLLNILNHFKNRNKNFAHGDIKPSNILISGNKTIKITDFGLANVFGKSASGWGSPLYLAPERFQLNAVPDPLSDIYSFGCVLFEMLYNRKPFTLPKRLNPSTFSIFTFMSGFT